MSFEAKCKTTNLSRKFRSYSFRRSSYILRANIFFFLIYRTFVTTGYANVIVSLRNFIERILSIVKYKYLTCHLRIQLLVLFYSHDFPYETTTRGNVKILQRYSLLIRKKKNQENKYFRMKPKQINSRHFRLRISTLNYAIFCHIITTSLQTKEYNATRLT